MTGRRWTTAAVTVAATLAALLVPTASDAAAAPTAPGVGTVASAQPCTTYWIARQRVAVRRPEGPVATMSSPVHHHLRKGDRVRSCIVAVARTDSGPAYRACGGEGHLWRIVPGGQVPQSCLRRA
ncbi:hypothetical protein [Streptomyces griseorubiginosus]|uniref:hypothetical protein n=1 Tax=Streptomyces griseorubiginosus TaxID=67304 RepID=UPI002E81FEDF|nr:hypothetical protein [Streptomyces griseorubiginosus]WUB58866.1 hypothetical protein OG942_43625 [Streptomyces griseorubiginosus]